MNRIKSAIESKIGCEQLDVLIRARIAPKLREAMQKTISGVDCSPQQDWSSLIVKLDTLQFDARSIAWFGRTEMHVAAQNLEPEELIRQIQLESYISLKSVDDLGRTPLHYA